MKPSVCRYILIGLLSCKLLEAATTIPRSYIAEYIDDDSFDHHQAIQQDLSNFNNLYKVKHRYSSPIFQGISFTLNQEQFDEEAERKHPVLSQLKSHSSIKRIYPIYEVPRPQWQPNLEGATFPYSNNDTEVFTIHQSLGVTGEGVLIGVLDSGIDYNHPALGQGFGKGYKVKLGKNLVPAKNDEKFGLTPLGENDPFDPCLNIEAGHGTHVAGIISGYDKNKNFTGIAPNATLAVFRIFGCEGGAGEDTVIQAMIMAYDAGCKVINLSLGIENGWPEDAMSIVAERLSNKGVIVVGVAGNQGGDGLYSQNSPATGRSVVSVASVDNSFYLSNVMQVSTIPDEYFPFVLSSSSEFFPNGTVANIISEDAAPFSCGNDTFVPEDLSGKILLVQRGLCTFDEKLTKAKDAGAIGVLFYDPDESVKSVVVARTESNNLPCAGIDLKLATRLISALKTNETLELLFPKKQEIIVTETAGQISAFSSAGPTYELDLKPTITGIGGEVFSTLPLNINNGWGVRSGTSMASPQVAGISALILDYYHKKGMNVTSKFVVEHLQNHAKIIYGADGKIEHPLIQGSGLIQPYTSINNKLHVSPAQISFNDTTSTTQYKNHTLTLKNSNPYPVRIKLSNLQSQSIQSYATNKSFIPTEPVIKNGTVFVKLKFSANQLTLAANSVTKVQVKVILPNPKSLRYHYQMYGGFIMVEETGTKKKLASIPYFGVLGRMIDIPIFDKNYPYLALKRDPAKRRFNPKTTFKFNLKNRINTRPAIVLRLLTGTANIEIGVYNKNNTFVGSLTGGPWIYNQRNKLAKENYFSTITWDGKVVVKESSKNPKIKSVVEKIVSIPNGIYYLSLRALKHFGNPKNNHDWQEWKSGPISVQN